jgi:hypothetical protein
MILHIEDEETWRFVVHSVLDKPEIRNLYNESPLKFVESPIEEEVPDQQLMEEIVRLEREAGDALSLVSVITAQVAREFLSRNLPAAIISDTSFPLNGKKVVEWLESHGYPNYPLIGLSGTPVDILEPELRRFFITGNARYFSKGEVLVTPENRKSFVTQVAYNMGWTRQIYGQGT